MCPKGSNNMTNASSWDNGSPNHTTGAGLGLHIDSHYQPVIFNNNAFNTIDLYHNGTMIAQNVNVSNKACKELIHVDIGLWLIKNNWNTWLKNNPHRFTITQNGNTNRFDI